MAVVITGVSEGGIGSALATYFMNQGYHVYGSVRKAEDAVYLQTRDAAAFTPLVFDVTDAAAVSEAAKTVDQGLEGHTLTALVNNAGMCMSPHPLIHMPTELVRKQMDVNLTAQLTVIQAFVPLLGTDMSRKGTPGRVINISSVYGSYALPFMGVYCASKSAIEGLSDALRLELCIFGIKVIVIRPGPIKTAIWQKAAQKGHNTGTGDWHAYDSTAYRPAMETSKRYLDRDNATAGKQIPPEHVARTVFKAVTAEQPKTHYLVTGNWLVNWLLPMMFPKHLVDRDLSKRFGLRRVLGASAGKAHTD